MSIPPTVTDRAAKLQAAQERVNAACVAFRAAVLYEAQRLSTDSRHAGLNEAHDCDCRACEAADELNEAAFAYAELKEQN